MPEGLSPIEIGRELHEHTKEPRDPDGGNRHSRTVQIGEALLLSLVTIAAAWSGYAAAKWNTESRLELAQAATLRNLATRADLSALSTRNFDSSTFNAWIATDPFNNPKAPPGPSYMPQYKLADQAKAEALDREAVEASAAGNHAGVVGDDYIRITVFLAAVLFLVGIGSTFKLHTIRFALIGIGSLLLVLATVLILQQPGLPG